MSREWTADELLEMGRGFQPPCVLMAAAELDLFTVLSDGPSTAEDLAGKLGTDLRATTYLLDALAAIRIVEKRDGRFTLPGSTAELLTEGSPGSVLPMLQHQANCLRRWAQLAKVVETGSPAKRRPSIRGEAGDEESFIAAMEVVSAPMASKGAEEME